MALNPLSAVTQRDSLITVISQRCSNLRGTKEGLRSGNGFSSPLVGQRACHFHPMVQAAQPRGAWAAGQRRFGWPSLS